MKTGLPSRSGPRGRSWRRCWASRGWSGSGTRVNRRDRSGGGNELPSRQGDLTMPLIQGGPPEWIWERTADPVSWQVVPVQAPEGHTVYELRVSCGLEIMRLHFFTADEARQLAGQLVALP